MLRGLVALALALVALAVALLARVMVLSMPTTGSQRRRTRDWEAMALAVSVLVTAPVIKCDTTLTISHRSGVLIPAIEYIHDASSRAEDIVNIRATCILNADDTTASGVARSSILAHTRSSITSTTNGMHVRGVIAELGVCI